MRRGGSDIEVESVYYFNSAGVEMFSMFTTHWKVYSGTKQKYYSVLPAIWNVPPKEIFAIICPKCIYIEGYQMTILDYLTIACKTQNPSMSLLDAKKAAEDMINLYRITKEEYYKDIEIMTAEQILDSMPQN